MGRYEIELDDELERRFKGLIKEKTGRPPARVVRALIRAFMENPDFFLDKISGFFNNEDMRKT